MQNRIPRRDPTPADAAAAPGWLVPVTDAAQLAAATQFDAEALARLIELDPTGANRVIERVFSAYCNSAARLLPQFDEGRRRGDLNAVFEVAHALKSSSASIGAIKLSAMCAEIDTMIRSQQHDGLEARVDSMRAELCVVLQALADVMGRKP